MGYLDMMKELREGFAYVEIAYADLANTPAKSVFEKTKALNKAKAIECLSRLIIFDFTTFFQTIDDELLNLNLDQQKIFIDNVYKRFIGYDTYIGDKKQFVKHTYIEIVENLPLKALLDFIHNETNSYLEKCVMIYQLMQRWYESKKEEMQPTEVLFNNLPTDTISSENGSKLFNALESGEYLAGAENDFLSLLQGASNKDKLDWVIEPPTKNGIAKGALIDLLVLLGYDKNDRTLIKRVVKNYFGITLEPASFARPNSTHHKDLSQIVNSIIKK